MRKKIIQLRSLLLVFLTHHMALPILRTIRSPQKFPYSGLAQPTQSLIIKLNREQVKPSIAEKSRKLNSSFLKNIFS